MVGQALPYNRTELEFWKQEEVGRVKHGSRKILSLLNRRLEPRLAGGRKAQPVNFGIELFPAPVSAKVPVDARSGC